jgi:hypothetical protein
MSKICRDCPVPRLEARWERGLLVVPHCPFCPPPHYYLPRAAMGRLWRRTVATTAGCAGVGTHSHHSNEVHFECKIFHGGGQLRSGSRPIHK